MGLPQQKFPEINSLTKVGLLMTFHKLFMTQVTVSYSKTLGIRELQHVSFTTFPLGFCSSPGSSCCFWSRGIHFLLSQRCHSGLSWEKIGGDSECGRCCFRPDRQTPLQARTKRWMKGLSQLEKWETEGKGVSRMTETYSCGTKISSEFRVIKGSEK